MRGMLHYFLMINIIKIIIICKLVDYLYVNIKVYFIM